MGSVLADIRHAARRWSARPALAITAILTLGLGIGAATAIFSVVDGVLLRPLPWKEPDRLVSIWGVRPQWRLDPVLGAAWDRGFISWPHFRDLERHNRTLAGVAVWSRARPVRVGGEAALAEALQVSSSFLPVLGIQPYLGRAFTSDEDDTPTESAMVTYEAWQRRFGGVANIIGRRVVVEDVPRTVVGVLPPRFTFEGLPPEFLLPFGTVPAGNRAVDNNFLRAVARLRPDVTSEQAAGDIEPVLRGGDPARRRTSRLELLTDTFFAGQPREALLVLLGAAGLLLLIACANVAGLLLGDAGARRQEVAVRRALGAGRARVARQMFAESAILAIGGAGLGLAAAWWMTPVLVAAAPARLPRIDMVTVDARVLVFAAIVSTATVLIFGVGPSLVGASVDPAVSLRDGRSAGRFRSRTQRVIVAGEIALAMVLLAGAALLGETVARLRSVPVGFDPTRLAVVRLRGPASAVPDMAARQLALLERLRNLPGVAAVGGTTAAPFGGSSSSTSVEADTRPGESFSAQRYFVTDGYFAAMGQPVIGRAFSQLDRTGDSVIVSQALANRAYRGDALGRRLRVNQRWLTIIGVVPDIRLRAYTESSGPAFYHYASQGNAAEIVIRASGDPRALLPAIRRTVTQFDDRLAFATLETMDTLMADTIDDERYRATLSSSFGMAALLLTAVGLYGLLSRTVAERQREIGVRMAVGARPSDVVRLVLTEGGGLLAAGLIVGIPAALAASRVIRSLLYGVEPSAPHIFVISSILLCGVALAAMLLPAARASRIDPIATIRSN